MQLGASDRTGYGTTQVSTFPNQVALASRENKYTFLAPLLLMPSVHSKL
uniref:Uncharacterized protein n=1 Tax=Arundo donax TaxID=35708 RepID=A0A0A9FPG4_ARUDO